MERKLKLSTKNKIVAGVCGGIGEYFKIDPTIVRIIFILLLFVYVSPPIIIYFVIWAIIPKDKKNVKELYDFSEFNDSKN